MERGFRLTSMIPPDMLVQNYVDSGHKMKILDLKIQKEIEANFKNEMSELNYI